MDAMGKRGRVQRAPGRSRRRGRGFRSLDDCGPVVVVVVVGGREGDELDVAVEDLGAVVLDGGAADNQEDVANCRRHGGDRRVFIPFFFV